MVAPLDTQAWKSDRRSRIFREPVVQLSEKQSAQGVDSQFKSSSELSTLRPKINQ